MEEWDFGFIIKEVRARIIIITVYNNKKKKLRESLDEIMEEKLKEEGNLIIAGDWNARIGWKVQEWRFRRMRNGGESQRIKR